MSKFVRRKLISAGGVLISGLCVLGSFWLLPPGGDYRWEMISGFGLGWTVIGVLRVLQAIGYLRDPKKAQELETYEREERTRFIREKAYAVGFYVGIFAMGLGVLAAGYLGNQEMGNILAVMIFVMLIAMAAAWRYFQKKY